LNLKPYGSDAAYITECTSCHQPVRGDDYVYTLPISASGPSNFAEVVNTHAAGLPASLPYPPLDWNAITLFIDPKAHTMSVLFGNPAAAAAANPRTGSPATPTYPAGSVLALVTWVQRDDPHWFGARVPDAAQTVEFVQIAASAQPPIYRRFSGPALAEDRGSAAAKARLSLILGLPPAALP